MNERHSQSRVSGGRSRHPVPAGNQSAAEGNAAARRQADHPVRRRRSAGRRRRQHHPRHRPRQERDRGSLRRHRSSSRRSSNRAARTSCSPRSAASRTSCSVSYVRQGEPLGLGHAVLVAQPLVGDEPFAVILADDVIDADTVGAGADDRGLQAGGWPGHPRRARCRKTQISGYGVIDAEPIRPRRLPHQRSGREAAAPTRRRPISRSSAATS